MGQASAPSTTHTGEASFPEVHLSFCPKSELSDYRVELQVYECIQEHQRSSSDGASLREGLRFGWESSYHLTAMHLQTQTQKNFSQQSEDDEAEQVPKFPAESLGQERSDANGPAPRSLPKRYFFSISILLQIMQSVMWVI